MIARESGPLHPFAKRYDRKRCTREVPRTHSGNQSSAGSRFAVVMREVVELPQDFGSIGSDSENSPSPLPVPARNQLTAEAAASALSFAGKSAQFSGSIRVE